MIFDIACFPVSKRRRGRIKSPAWICSLVACISPASAVIISAERQTPDSAVYVQDLTNYLAPEMDSALDWVVWGSGGDPASPGSTAATDFKSGGNGISKNFATTGAAVLENTGFTTVKWNWSDGTNQTSGSHDATATSAYGMRTSFTTGGQGATGSLAFTYAGAAAGRVNTATLLFRVDIAGVGNWTLQAIQGGQTTTITSLGSSSNSNLAIVKYDGPEPLTLRFVSTLGGGANPANRFRGYAATLSSGVAADPYESWALGAGLDGSPGKQSGFDVDPDNDGVANGLEWILGGNPLMSDNASVIPEAVASASGIEFSYFREDDSKTSTTQIVQYGTDLAGWTDVIVGEDSDGEEDVNGVSVTITDNGESPDRITVSIPESKAPEGRLFARLRATRP